MSRPGKKGQQVSPASHKCNVNECLSNIEDLEKKFEERLKQMEASYEERLKLIEVTHEAKLDSLHRVIKEKDEVIGRLNIDIGELKRTSNFLTNETTEIKKSVSENTKMLNTKITSTVSDVKEIKLKTVDLEDRSRRCNLVFYNFPEATQGQSEDCEKLVVNLLGSLRIFEQDEQIWIERAHRLGRKKNQKAKNQDL